MAIVQILRCDVCGGDDNVATVTVSRKGSRSFEVDLCDGCWDKQMSHGLGIKGRAAKRKRSPSRMQVTEVLPPD